jgi:hypothetical protein
VVSDVTPADDLFHPVGDPDPLWTETTWWGFYAADGSVGGMVYAFFRPNLGVATLVTSVWDDADVEPWRAPYSRSLWHLPMPDGDLDDLQLGHLHLRRLEPLARYHLAYDDPGSLTLDLTYAAAMPPHLVVARPTLGHLDQLCRVTGTIGLRDRTVDVDALAVRDRSWYVRDDLRSSHLRRRRRRRALPRLQPAGRRRRHPRRLPRPRRREGRAHERGSSGPVAAPGPSG